MAKFRFRLQPVLEARQRAVDERQRELAQLSRDLVQAEAEAAALDGERETQRTSLTRDHAQFDADVLRATYAHLAYLDRAIEEQAVRVAACAAEVVRAQTRLVAADAQRKVLDTLKARRLEAFVADEAQIEQREVDDQNARRYGRAQLQRGNQR